MVPTVPDGSVNIHLASFLCGVHPHLNGTKCQVAFVQEKPVASTRNRIMREFLQSGMDYCLMIDDDAVPDLEGFQYLWEAIQRPDVDAVGGWSVFITPHGPRPVVMKFKPDGSWVEHTELLHESQPGLHPIPDGGIGAHCLMVKRATAQRFVDEKVVWFKDVLRDGSLERKDLIVLLNQYRDSKAGMYDEIASWLGATKDTDPERLGERIVGQDIWFCREMHRLGLRLWVDTRVFWGHIKPCDLRGEFEAREMLARAQQEVPSGA